MKYEFKVIIYLFLLCLLQNGCSKYEKKHYSNSSIIGKWESNSSIFYFKENGEFSNIITKPMKGAKKNFFGKYIVVDSGVFIRYYGSMHWQKEGHNRDYHTSIGSQYLYLATSEILVDNQEDYETKWQKK